METIYSNHDVVALAEKIFVNDINDEATREIQTEKLAEASLFAAEIFFDKARLYHNGSLTEHFKKCNGVNEVDEIVERPSEDRRKCDRRKSEVSTSPKEDEAFTALERALKEQFLNATLMSIMRK